MNTDEGKGFASLIAVAILDTVAAMTDAVVGFFRSIGLNSWLGNLLPDTRGFGQGGSARRGDGKRKRHGQRRRRTGQAEEFQRVGVDDDANIPVSWLASAAGGPNVAP